jgi:hypothetical protein
MSAAVAISRTGVRPQQVIDKAEKELKIRSIFRIKTAFLVSNSNLKVFVIVWIVSSVPESNL